MSGPYRQASDDLLGNYGVAADLTQVPGGEPYFILGDRDWAFAAIMTVIVWKYFGFHMMIYIVALQGVPHDLVEAARIEGAKPFDVVRHVFGLTRLKIGFGSAVGVVLFVLAALIAVFCQRIAGGAASRGTAA